MLDHRRPLGQGAQLFLHRGDPRLELADLRAGSAQRGTQRLGELVELRQGLQHDVPRAHRNRQPELRNRPRTRLVRAVRSTIHADRNRCNPAKVRCANDLTGTLRIGSLRCASSSAAASARSVLVRCT